MTSIEWTDVVWNPVTGCSKVSAGCRNCYAERMAQRLKGRYGYPIDDPFAVALHHDRLEQPLRWRKPRRVFVCSMGDLFHPEVPAWFIRSVFEVMATSPHHTFQVLTKRPRRIVPVLYGPEGGHYLGPGDHYDHILLGTSVEDNASAIARLSHLDHPLLEPWTKWASYEPALDEVNWDRWADVLGWLVCGGESGPGARPMGYHLPRHARDFCVRNGIPLFFKQWGIRANNPDFWDPTARERGGATKGGHLLDGREWQQFPRARA